MDLEDALGLHVCMMWSIKQVLGYLTMFFALFLISIIILGFIDKFNGTCYPFGVFRYQFYAILNTKGVQLCFLVCISISS